MAMTRNEQITEEGVRQRESLAPQLLTNSCFLARTVAAAVGNIPDV